MNGGIAQTRSGNAVGMMSGNMMMNCTDGGVAMMKPMQQAIDEICQGQVKLSDSDTSNDTDGVNQLNNGLTMMNSALDQSLTAMNCMDHGHMM